MGLPLRRRVGRIACFVCVAFGCLSANAQVRLLGRLQYQGQPVGSGAAPIAYSPDGRYLAASWATSVFVYNAQTGKAVSRGPADKRLHSLHFLPDGSVMFGPHAEQTTMPLWNPATGKVLNVVDLGRATNRQFDVSPRGDVYAMVNSVGQNGMYQMEVSLWDVKTGAEVRRTRLNATMAQDAAFHPGDGSLLAISHDKGIYIVKTADLSVVNELGRSKGKSREIAFSPDGALLAANYYEGTVKVWNVASGDLAEGYGEKVVQGADRAYRCIGFSPDGRVLAVGGGSKRPNGPSILALLNPLTGDLLASMGDKVPGVVSHLAFSPDGTRLATTSGNETAIRLWDVSAFSARVGNQEAPENVQPKPPAAVKTRTWTSDDGKFSVEAELIKQTAAAVRLKKPDGSIITVPKLKLSEGDLQYLERLE